MSDLKTVKAAMGRRVVTPAGDAVPAAGFRVDPRDPWWARALASGDVVELSEADKADAEQKKPNPVTAPSNTTSGEKK